MLATSTMQPASPKNVISVEFYLKAYLHDLVVDLCGPDGININPHNAVGSMAMSCLTPKPSYADQTTADFIRDRKRMLGYIPVRNSVHQGYHVHRLALFEDLVEHLFYHMLLAYVDAKGEEGMTQNEAIRMFCAKHNIGLERMDEGSIKKNVIRRRKRMEVARSGK